MLKLFYRPEISIPFSFFLAAGVTMLAVPYLHEGSFVPLLNPVIGVAFGLYLIHERKVLPSLVSGFLIGHIFMYLFIDQREVPFAILSGFSFAFILTVELLVGKMLFNRYISEAFYRSIRLSEGIAFYGIALLMGLIAASSASFIYYFIGVHTMSFQRVYLTIFASHFLSVATLAPLVYLSSPPFMSIRPVKSVLKCTGFVLLFFIAIYYFLQGSSSFVFYRHNYILVTFYIIAAAMFSYFTMTIMTVGLLLISAFFYVNPAWSLTDFYVETYTLIVLAHISVTLGLIIKWFLDNQSRVSKSLEFTNESLDTTLMYVQNLLNITKDIMRSSTKQEELSEKTHALIEDLFSDADAIFSYQNKKGVFENFQSNRYQGDGIPWLYDLHDENLFRHRNVHVIENITEALKAAYGPKYVNLHKHESRLKARIYLTFRFSQKDWLMVGLDYFRPLRQIDHEAINRMRQLTDLLNRLFAKHFTEKSTLRLKRDIILTLVRTLDLYDKYTKGHSETVANIAHGIGEAMGLSKEQLDDIYWAGILHDIGKLGVEHDVLNSNKRLNDEEYETVKHHVDMGYGVLRDFESLAGIARIMRDHHERVDGKGYPEGLQDEQITLGGKILAVSDAIATMASDRPYQAKKTKDAIIEELNGHKGTQFSSDVANTAIRLIRKNALI
ncbi:MAG: HD domain-containing phosphohydrolase [Candidatus Izemoplasmataceae bacterium]